MASEPGYLYVKNWDELQHYKTRRPPWIKLYGRLLSDWEFLELGEQAQWQLIKIWIIAAEDLPGGWLKDDPKLIRSLIKVSEGAHLRLNELIARGWLQRRSQAEYEEARASTVLAKNLPRASTLEQRTEESSEEPSFLQTSSTDATNGHHEERKEGFNIGALLREIP